MAFYAAIVQAVKQKKDQAKASLEGAGDQLMAYSQNQPNFGGITPPEPQAPMMQQAGDFTSKLMNAIKGQQGGQAQPMQSTQPLQPPPGEPSPFRNSGASLRLAPPVASMASPQPMQAPPIQTQQPVQPMPAQVQPSQPSVMPKILGVGN